MVINQNQSSMISVGYVLCNTSMEIMLLKFIIYKYNIYIYIYTYIYIYIYIYIYMFVYM